ncbi:sulfate permease [Xylaria bambusicola]|uniref:sulfate permease n=1 Tax=Xylaria bambusicola TaxID=326684 RepID=UPI0020079ADD|nr:sulfate permease [Xylaria bambusicola]KAI0512453.1 sulfate permease [Xylaria bambusicola]
MSSSSRIGHGLAKVLGIKLAEPETERVTRGESVFSIQTADSFFEEQPTVKEVLASIVPTRKGVYEYILSLFPFLSWIGFYNVQWLTGDLVAGITIGAVVVPQGMAYAKLAELPVQFGLYSSFVGVILYWFFATSKDITIGPVAVLSTVTGTVVNNVVTAHPEYKDTPWVIASALAVICGAIVLFIGLIRFGWIVELIPVVSLAAFMTGSAINIAAGQVPGLLGIEGFSTRDSTYLVIINTLKGLPRTNLNAAIGLTALFLLYAIRFSCGWAARKYPNRQKVFFFLNTLRSVFAILLYTLVSWLVNMHRRKNPAFKILGTVPRGFTHAAVPTINTDIISSFASEIPATVIVLLIEHIAISKSFGRVNNYRINPSQEMVAIGVTNVIGPFLGGYPATGSFSRTAIKSKAGVKTPFAGVITGIIVLLAIYALTAVFFYIPNAALSAVIIHAVGDLITSPNTVYGFWRVSPLEPIIFFIGVIVTIFTTIEIGIYTTISISFAIFLVRNLRAKGTFLGRVQVHSVVGDHIISGNDNRPVNEYGTFKPDPTPSAHTRNVFLPIDHQDGSNPGVELTSPYPGIFIYRFSELLNYPSVSSTMEYLVEYVFAHTRPTTLRDSKKGERPWNDPGPKRPEDLNTNLPTLKAIILDFSSVNNVDVTSTQMLIDIRNQLDRYTAPDVVDWHIACISNRWTKRALLSAGFGYPAVRADGAHSRWKSIFSIAEIGGNDSAAAAAEREANEKELVLMQSRAEDPEAGRSEGIIQPSGASSSSESVVKSKNPDPRSPRRAVVHGINRPLFHVDLTSALQSAIANVEAREEFQRQGASGSDSAP